MSGKPGQENSLGNPTLSVNGQRRAIREIQGVPKKMSDSDFLVIAASAA